MIMSESPGRPVLEAILALKHPDGTIHPSDIVSVARNPRSVLHSHFEWDDSAAAEQYRLEQARHLLRVCVTVIDQPGAQPVRVRAFVSLSDEAGYRPTIDVLSHEARRERLLKDALNELESFRRKYKDLIEVADVVAAIEQVTDRVTAPPGGRK